MNTLASTLSTEESHLSIYPLEDKGDHKLAVYDVTTSAMTLAAQRAARSDDPQLELKRHLCAFYCFDPRITPEDLLSFKIIALDHPNKTRVELQIRK
jgi:hypothetical protein